MARVVVVGGGVAGLATAVRLRAARHDVVVLERSDEIGGKAGRREGDGYGWDLGPTLVTLPAVYRDLFATTGPPLEECLDLVPVDPVCRYTFADGTTFDMPNASRARIGSALDEALGPGAGEQWLALLARGGLIWQGTRDSFLGAPLRGLRAVPSLARGPGALRAVAPHRSLRGLGEQYLREPHLRTLLDRYATYSGSDPRRAPAALAAVPYVEQAFGAWAVVGGVHRLAAETARRAALLGAEVRTGAEVAEVLVEGGAVQGVRLADGSTVPADVVVSALDAHVLYRDLLPGRQAARELAALRRLPPSSSGFLLLLGLRGTTPGLDRHNVLFGPDYDAEFDALFGTGTHQGRPRPVADPTLYLHRGGSAPDGHEALTVLVNAPPHRPDRPDLGIDWDADGSGERVRRPRARGAGRARHRRARPRRHPGLAVARRPRPSRGRRGRLDLRQRDPRCARAAAAPGQRRAGARAVPRRRVDPPRWWPAHGGHVGRGRQRPRGSRLTSASPS